MPEERVGSVGEEAVKLLRALAQPTGPTVADQDAPEQDGDRTEHMCTTGWCPVCRVVGLVKDDPEVVARLADSALVFARSLRDVIDHVTDRREDPS